MQPGLFAKQAVTVDVDLTVFNFFFPAILLPAVFGYYLTE
jgi:hypothetical protein